MEEIQQDSITNVYVKSGKVVFKGKNKENGIILSKGMSGTLKEGNETPEYLKVFLPTLLPGQQGSSYTKMRR